MSHIKLGMIVAMTHESGIALNGTIPWYHREDLQRFKNLTMGCPIIMGRKTWESLPRKPLPGRTHIVITRNMEYEASGAIIVHSREDAIREATRSVLEDVETHKNPEGWVWVIGGQQIYEMFMCHRYLRRIEITYVPDEIKCDTHFIPFPLWFKKTGIQSSSSFPLLYYNTYESRGPDDEIVRRRSIG